MKTHIHKILKLLFSVDVFADTEKKQSSVMSSSNTNIKLVGIQAQSSQWKNRQVVSETGNTVSGTNKHTVTGSAFLPINGNNAHL